MKTKRELGHYTIELDCPPGQLRPDALLPGILEGTGLSVDDFKNTSRSFGNWEYRIYKDKDADYLAAQKKIKIRIENLYHQGRIRYGSW